MISLDLMKSSEIRLVGDRSKCASFQPISTSAKYISMYKDNPDCVSFLAHL